MKDYIEQIKIPVACLFVIGVVLFAHFHEFFFYKSTLATNHRIKSYQETLIKMVQVDPPQAFAYFRQTLKDEPMVYATCHGIAHEMGHAAYDTFGLAEALHYQDAICGGGYIHGVIEGEFGKLQESDLLIRATSICGHDELCLHGIGHGLMIATHSNIEKSIEICNAVAESEKTNCYDGVFMHAFDLEETGIPKGVTTEDKALLVCQNIPTYAKTNCYYYLPRVDSAQGIQKEYQLCKSLPMGDDRNSCVLGFGVMQMKYAPTFDEQSALLNCAVFSDQFYMNLCRTGVERYKKLQEEGLNPQ